MERQRLMKKKKDADKSSVVWNLLLAFAVVMFIGIVIASVRSFIDIPLADQNKPVTDAVVVKKEIKAVSPVTQTFPIKYTEVFKPSPALSTQTEKHTNIVFNLPDKEMNELLKNQAEILEKQRLENIGKDRKLVPTEKEIKDIIKSGDIIL